MARIIIADDDEMVIEIARAALEARGHLVGALLNGARVADVVATKCPDLVILDCVMPEVSGVDVVRQVRASRMGYSVPVLMLTSRRSAVDEEIALRAGADEYLRKPFCADELVAVVESLLGKAKMAESSARPANFTDRRRSSDVQRSPYSRTERRSAGL